MNIDLTREEVTKILKEKFGEATFRVLYIQSDRQWEKENNKKISELRSSLEIKKHNYMLYFD